MLKIIKRLLKDKQALMETALVLLISLGWNELVYMGSRLFTHSRHHFDMTMPIDLLVPFVPWTILIYFGCFAVWGVSYFLCAAQDSKERDRFFCADIIAKTVTLILFLLIPTTNVRPNIMGGGIWNFIMSFLYKIDPADNLFPSLHCVVSWLCWIGLRKRKDVSPIYRCFTLLTAIAVCISTLTTRQHVLADVISGIILAEISYLIAGIPKACKVYSSFISRLTEATKAKKK